MNDKKKPNGNNQLTVTHGEAQGQILLQSILGVAKPDLFEMQARTIASKINTLIQKEKWFTPILGEKGKLSKHINVEGWTALASMCHVVPGSEYLRREERNDGKFAIIARGYLRLLDGSVIATADQICSNDEKGKEWMKEYHLLGMAQTRAVSRVCAEVFRYIIKMAGYATTPAEEIIDTTFTDTSKSTSNPTLQSQKAQSDNGNSITQKQRGMIYGLLKEISGTDNKDTWKVLLKQIGFESTKMTKNEASRAIEELQKEKEKIKAGSGETKEEEFLQNDPL